MKQTFNSERARKAYEQLDTTTTFEEQMWIFRNITYDKIKYFSENNKGQVYDGKHSQLNIEQATNLQRQISTCTDLFTQSVDKCREFDQGYLKSYEFAAPYLSIISDLKDRIDSLEQTIRQINEISNK